MKKDKLFAVLFTVFCLVLLTAAVSADQEGNSRWCNIDSYGCWVTDKDTGGQSYIMFWSEESRQYFMGDTTEPYKNVVDCCVDCESGKLPLGPGRGYRSGGVRVTYHVDGKVFNTAEKFLQYIADRDGYDSCFFVSNNVIDCK
ncbi:MAG: hypothetical protein IJI14_05420 [Anaerolineaceae bacterium]|nr:hypothetical protein [Anaerolineaceae bacterium]